MAHVVGVDIAVVAPGLVVEDIAAVKVAGIKTKLVAHDRTALDADARQRRVGAPCNVDAGRVIECLAGPCECVAPAVERDV